MTGGGERGDQGERREEPAAPRGCWHETRALLRAHLSAAAGRGPHLTRHCVVCHRLLRLALESRERR